MSLLPYQFPWRSLGMLNYRKAKFKSHLLLPYQFPWHSLGILNFELAGFNCHVPSSLSIPMTFTRIPQFWSSRFQLPCPAGATSAAIAGTLTCAKVATKNATGCTLDTASRLCQDTYSHFHLSSRCAVTAAAKAGPTARSLQVLGVPRLRFVHLVLWATKSHPPRAFHLAALGTTTLLWICSSGWARARIRAWGRGCHEMSSDVNDQIVSNQIVSLPFACFGSGVIVLLWLAQGKLQDCYSAFSENWD